MLEPRTAGGLGWRPSLPDYRDERYRFHNALKAELLSPAQLPPMAQPQRKEVDRLPVLDQGQSSGCTGFGTALIDAVERNVSMRSPTFIYYEARRAIGETDVDNGAYGRDAVKVCAELGAPTVRLWPATLDNEGVPHNLFIDPVAKADKDAAKRKAYDYHPLGTGQEFRSCMAGGHLFAIGITCYSNMFSPLVDRFGIIPPPAGGDEGGHWLPFIAYYDDVPNSEWGKWARDNGFPAAQLPQRAYEFQNSWGEGWGRNGRGLIGADYLENPYLASDGQTLRGFARDDMPQAA